ncbi:MAG: acetyl/propionyl/methylcrotonyl-CoA carboxylase subunit alpha [Coxiellaceae bacterium]|nr:acetyl/propionyl/methylcrotonyl-CoA carboxylase subunit alpha [Coxiellaceae bacterium]
MLFDKILIANRGEIACRVIETAKRLQIKTVAVYSDIDAHAKHVAMADEAFCIGPAPSNQSYLCGDKIIQLAKDCGAQAIHPGYGFLSENAGFARACKKAGIVFVGPSGDAIDAMGSKTQAKILMKKQGVPTTPGYEGKKQSVIELSAEAEAIGFPVLFKASAGGGGKGMRLVNESAELTDAIESAKREAASSFCSDELLIEKYLDKSRHVEVQIFLDQQGNGVYLYDRDCSVQRRHQKIIEEAPAPGINDSIKKQMGEAAIQAAKAINYCGAGTVEFLFDAPDKFYFMEMNTRLQVEHPVTEKVTGLDLVEWQLLVAAGQDLPLQQNEIKINGHAFEARICAEDPFNNFNPSCGHIDILHMPETNEHVRIDSGVRQGDEITPYYDPMIAKLITWDQDRDSALQRLHNALAETVIIGVSSNVDLLATISQHNDFKAAELTTRFLDIHPHLMDPTTELTNTQQGIAAAGYMTLRRLQARRLQHNSNDCNSPWFDTDHWRMGNVSENVLLWFREEPISTNIAHAKQPRHALLTLNDNSQCDVSLKWHQGHWFEFTLDGELIKVRILLLDNKLYMYIDGKTFVLDCTPPGSGDLHHGANSELSAPMPGTVIEVVVKPGDTVNEGDKLIVMEAMKMEHTMKAPYAGTVTDILFAKGDTFREGDELLQISMLTK